MPGQTLDASNVFTRLWVGGSPPFDCDLPEFDVLALCARELQPERLAFHGKVLRCPIDDAVLNVREVGLAVMTSRSTARALAQGKRVLVTCAAGINRSALVACLALAQVTRYGAAELVGLVRQQRSEHCLSNPYFEQLLHNLIGAGRQR